MRREQPRVDGTSRPDSPAVHNRGRRVDGLRQYRELAGKVLDLDHTYVPPAGRGRGIASQLAAHALRYARDSGYKVLPSCPFIAAYIERHAEFHDLRA
jgi:predicted GNAT family acetyltransferase